MAEELRNCETDLVPLTLVGGRVTSGFRSALFAAAGRAGVSVNEYVLLSVGEKLTRAGVPFPGVFISGEQQESRQSGSSSKGGTRVLQFGDTRVAAGLFDQIQTAAGDQPVFEYALRLMQADIEARR